MDEKEDEYLDHTAERDYLLREEVTRVECRCMPLQEVGACFSGDFGRTTFLCLADCSYLIPELVAVIV